MAWAVGNINLTVELQGLTEKDLALFQRAQELNMADDLGYLIRSALQALIEKKIREQIDAQPPLVNNSKAVSTRH
jgi:hypothetical protein